MLEWLVGLGGGGPIWPWPAGKLFQVAGKGVRYTGCRRVNTGAHSTTKGDAGWVVAHLRDMAVFDITWPAHTA